MCEIAHFPRNGKNRHLCESASYIFGTIFVREKVYLFNYHAKVMFIDKLTSLFPQAYFRLERMPGYTLLSLLIVFVLSALTLWYQVWRATRIEPGVVMKAE